MQHSHNELSKSMIKILFTYLQAITFSVSATEIADWP